MTCNVIFDFHSPHNNEYWFKCTHCGARDWFAYYDKPESDRPIKNCNPDFKATQIDPNDPYSDLYNLSKEQLMAQIVRYRNYMQKLEQFQEQVYTIYPDMAVTLQEKYND